MIEIARVFPSRTSMSPIDNDAYFDVPDIFTPKYDEIHISVTFTWDKKRAEYLAEAWRNHGKVKIGGVAITGESNEPFIAGMYLRRGVTITSRGCVNKCKFCFVNKALIEFDDFPEGNIVQDNNILACSDRHRRLVFDMLKKQRKIDFRGGLEAGRITDTIADELRSLAINTLWLACDHPNALKPLKKAVEKLKSAGFTRNHLYCYCLIGTDMAEEENRLKEIWDIGCMPFAQLFRDKNNAVNYSPEYKVFQRKWSRPAIIRSMMTKNGSQ